MPTYIISHDSTLVELAQLAPSTMSELRAVSGVGALKLERFGTQLLEVVAGED
ncbi:HRDC domain-containing protein [Mycoavidus sp. HKI]|uniref:HRDC domain-containing protein n=1 Tax=Mycoavidus sp. HKI TaxID=2840467 RepID=UPI001CBB3922|nr:HRDC domain-containing protein [Mycoavidus sp. HKI]UAW63567.1 HRDC domain-containing protein [Mycoavidus sp. HKI]